MEYESFKILEDKITRVLEKVETLKQENADLKNQLETIKREYNEKAAECEELSLNLQNAKGKERDPDKEEKIKKKVSGLLEKLENF